MRRDSVFPGASFAEIGNDRSSGRTGAFVLRISLRKPRTTSRGVSLSRLRCCQHGGRSPPRPGCPKGRFTSISTARSGIRSHCSRGVRGSDGSCVFPRSSRSRRRIRAHPSWLQLCEIPVLPGSHVAAAHGDRHLGPHAGDRQGGGEDTYWPSSPQADVAKAVGVIAKRKP